MDFRKLIGDPKPVSKSNNAPEAGASYQDWVKYFTNIFGNALVALGSEDPKEIQEKIKQLTRKYSKQFHPDTGYKNDDIVKALNYVYNLFRDQQGSPSIGDVIIPYVINLQDSKSDIRIKFKIKIPFSLTPQFRSVKDQFKPKIIQSLVKRKFKELLKKAQSKSKRKVVYPDLDKDRVFYTKTIENTISEYLKEKSSNLPVNFISVMIEARKKHGPVLNEHRKLLANRNTIKV